MNKICIKCKKEIDLKKDNYFRISLFRTNKNLGNDFIHESCHKQVNLYDNYGKELMLEAGNILKNFRERGLLPEKEVVIQ